MSVIVVGAGISGLACARALADAGVPVRVFERGRVVGGRLASKRIDGRRVDIGAAYLTADDPGFVALVHRWQAAGLARPWTTTMRVYDDSAPPRPADGPLRWAADGGLRTLAEDLATGLDVSLRHPVSAVGPGPVVDGEPADAVVLAMPGPQALRLLLHATTGGLPGPTDDAAQQTGPAQRSGSVDDPASLDGAVAVARAQRWSPVLAAVLRYPTRAWQPFAGAFVNDHPVLGAVCDDGDRRGDGAPVLVAHSTAEVAARHLDDPDAAGAVLERATQELLGLAEPAASVHVHRWTYAQPRGDEGAAAYHLDHGVALVGDAFGRPRVQTAWLSGHALGTDLARRLTDRLG